MAKYYIRCGTLEIIHSCNKTPREAAMTAIWETNENDTLDEYFYIDERGYRDYISADGSTEVFCTKNILADSGWTLEQ